MKNISQASGKLFPRPRVLSEKVTFKADVVSLNPIAQILFFVIPQLTPKPQFRVSSGVCVWLAAKLNSIESGNQYFFWNSTSSGTPRYSAAPTVYWSMRVAPKATFTIGYCFVSFVSENLLFFAIFV